MSSSDQYGNHPPQGRRQPSLGPQAPGPGSSTQPSSFSAGGGGDSEISADERSGSKSPLNMGMNFLRGLGVGDKRNRDGQPAKRRGPKPDSKPALTRRQELNRQAQRTHRERKEYYIKTLEQQVMQLKEVYAGTVNEKQAVIDENEKLKDLLTMHGIPYETVSASTASSAAVAAAAFHPQAPGSSATGTAYASDAFATAPPSGFSPQSQQFSSQSTSPGPGYLEDASLGGPVGQQPPQPPPMGLDYDQLGVDFVLALEASCADHMQFMFTRSLQHAPPQPPSWVAAAAREEEDDVGEQPLPSASTDSNLSPIADISNTAGPTLSSSTSATTSTTTTPGFPPPTLDLPPSGHALMWSAPSASQLAPLASPLSSPDSQQLSTAPSSALHMEPYAPAAYAHPQRKTGLPNKELMRLLRLSADLPLDAGGGEITPVMALKEILRDERVGWLDRGDWERLIEELKGRVKCYGFGAVMEEFELKDALNKVFAAKFEGGQ